MTVDVYPYELTYDAFDGPSPLTVHRVETEESTVLFGAGHTSTAKEVLSICQENNVDALVPEHGDIDHFGGIPLIQETMESPPIVALPTGDLSPVADAGVEIDYELTPGETPWGFDAISVPGHTPGNMSFLAEDTLVAGDTLVGSDFAPVSGDKWSGAFAIAPPSRNTGGDSAAIASVGKLLSYSFESTFVAHGSSVHENAYQEVAILVDDLAHGIDRTEF